ncbi:amidase [Bryobacterales bacterium F-183]|nr:amidase [Bryobacterales bacterium F-183]
MNLVVLPIEQMPLVELARRIREREISPLEAVDAYLARIEQINPKINAFVRVFAEEARAAAKGVLPEGPLQGVPLTIKDSLDVAGYRTTCGSRFLGETAAVADSAAARNFRQSGAILLGKTNTPEFLANYETDNHLTGRTNNPWNLACTAGGSSGGESAAISAFCSAGGMGSDGGGSVRVPAHFCGIAGLKPTPGRVSAAGHVPAIEHPGGLLGVVGPMARTVSDVRVLFDATAGYDDADPFSVPVPLRYPGERELRGLRIGVIEQFHTMPVQSAVRDAVRQASRLLGSLGFAVDEFVLAPEVERAPNVWAFFFTDLPSRMTAQFIAGREEMAHWTGTEFLGKIAGTPEPSGLRVVEMLGERDRIRRALLEQMREVPVLLTPVCGVTAFPHRQRRWSTVGKEIGLFGAMMPATLVNIVGFPALSVPMAISPEGLPVGVQLIGRPYQEELLLALGERLEEARGPLPAPPL